MPLRTYSLIHSVWLLSTAFIHCGSGLIVLGILLSHGECKCCCLICIVLAVCGLIYSFPGSSWTHPASIGQQASYSAPSLSDLTDSPSTTLSSSLNQPVPGVFVRQIQTTRGDWCIMSSLTCYAVAVPSSECTDIEKKKPLYDQRHVFVVVLRHTL